MVGVIVMSLALPVPLPNILLAILPNLGEEGNFEDEEFLCMDCMGEDILGGDSVVPLN